MKTIFALFALLLLSACVTPSEQDRPNARAYADEAMAYASAHTGMPAVDIPRFRYVEGMEYGAGLYDFNTKTVYLPADWEPDHHGISTLVHEFVHAMQFEHRNDDFDHMTQTAFDICKTLEIEAHVAAYTYEMEVAPKETKVGLLGFTIEDASAVHADRSCRDKYTS